MKDHLATHWKILRSAASNDLPERIDEQSGFDLKVFRELFEAGLVDAIDASSMDGHSYLDPRITVEGREYLNKLEVDVRQSSWGWKSRIAAFGIFRWVATVAGGVLVGYVIAKLT